ncbi:tetratricopeptide repeat protein [Pantoea sp. GL120224-02]|uniref:tetratricopeptide repeat protein n=1 Tax=Pantoea sp. GL120224-02 TaxID=1378084 RepID=UPI000BC7CF37|nr:tetratricopeptide repeat protein [Pantoea sp. GL120224-02]SNY79271.1 Tetratricopeptide repeat-containing protein [Pantoea sp. GL120224-02]
MKQSLRLFIVMLMALPALATAKDKLSDLQSEWARCQYRTMEQQKTSCFSTLSTQAHAAVKQADRDPELLIWSGIIDSSWAGAKGGLGALTLVKQAKASLEKALALDPRALQGSAFTSLGALYYQVPGWPIGFGDNKKAETLLKQALNMNPDGIDANYFYGDYLLKQGDASRARQYLEKAMQAPPRAGREIADTGRRADIQRDLNKIR